MTLAVDIHRPAQRERTAAYWSTQGSAHLDWTGPHLPVVGDRIERPGAVWVVRGRRWSQIGELTITVEEYSTEKEPIP